MLTEVQLHYPPTPPLPVKSHPLGYTILMLVARFCLIISLSKYLAGQLKPHMWMSEAYVKNSAALVPELDSLTLALSDILVGLDIVSL